MSVMTVADLMNFAYMSFADTSIALQTYDEYIVISLVLQTF